MSILEEYEKFKYLIKYETINIIKLSITLF